MIALSQGTTILTHQLNRDFNDMRVEERYHRVNMGQMELTVTINDPTAYSKPWIGRNKLLLRLIPTSISWRCSALGTEAQDYKKNMGK